MSLLHRHRYSLASAAACLAYVSFSAGLGMTPFALLFLGTSFLTADSTSVAEPSVADESRSSRPSSHGAGPGRGDDGPRDGHMGSHDDEPDQSAGMSRVPSATGLSEMVAAAALADMAEEAAEAVAQPAREAETGAQLHQTGSCRAAQDADPPVASPAAAVQRQRGTRRLRRPVAGRRCTAASSRACGAAPRPDAAAVVHLVLLHRLHAAAVAH